MRLLLWFRETRRGLQYPAKEGRDSTPKPCLQHRPAACAAPGSWCCQRSKSPTWAVNEVWKEQGTRPSLCGDTTVWKTQPRKSQDLHGLGLWADPRNSGKMPLLSMKTRKNKMCTTAPPTSAKTLTLTTLRILHFPMKCTGCGRPRRLSLLI